MLKGSSTWKQKFNLDMRVSWPSINRYRSINGDCRNFGEFTLVKRAYLGLRFDY